MNNNQYTDPPNFGVPNSRGIDTGWRSASDYDVDPPAKADDETEGDNND